MIKKLGIMLFMSIALIGCSKDIEEELTTVNVVLQPGGKSTVTGTDGSFSYKDVEPGTYTIEIKKEGYLPNDKEVTVVAGETSPAHLLIERIPAIVTVDRKTLDFGNSKSLNTMSFSIVNRTYEDLAWNIEQNCEWITEVKPSSGVLKYGKTESVVVVIDRSKFEGAVKTSLAVRSSNGYSEIEILAVSGDMPKLEMYDATEVRAYSATLNAEVTFVGKPEYIERGFVYGTTVNPTTESNLGKVTVPKNSTAKYSATIENLNINTSYYARAYAISALGTTYSSANKVFTTHAILPEVTTQEVIDADFYAGTATLLGTIVSVGEPAYIECGFAYGISPNPTINDNKVIKNISGEGAFSSYLTNIHVGGGFFYVRAYAKNEAGIVYGNNIKVTECSYVVVPGTDLMVAKYDLGTQYKPSLAVKICEDLVLGGYSDWRLPTIGELGILYNHRDYIGGFTTSYGSSSVYWSSTRTSSSSNFYYCLYFTNGAATSMDSSSRGQSVRPVRTIKE